MSFEDDREIQRRRKSDSESHSPPDSSRKGKKKPPTGDVGDALRSVYQRTIDEDIPPEMLDLLGKLG